MCEKNIRIGLLRPGISPSTEMEFHRYIPREIILSTCALPYKQITFDGLSEMSARVEDFSGMYRGFPFDLLVFACTTGSMLGGTTFDTSIADRMVKASGIPSITTSIALLEAFQRIDVKRLSIITPYNDALNKLEVDFLAAAGYETMNIHGMGIENVVILPFISPDTFFKMAVEVDITYADALFISCTGIMVMSIIEKLEHILKIPVITSNQVSIWSAMRHVGYKNKLPGLGILGQL